MLKLLSAVRTGVSILYGDIPSPKKTGFHNACTPDEIISAAIVQSIAKNFDDWKLKVVRTSNNRDILTLGNEKKKITASCVGRKMYSWETDYIGYEDYMANDVKIAPECGKAIFNSYEKIKTERDRIERIAAEKKKEMERLEAAWNVAENLLGMKRLPNGALVPIEQIEKARPAPVTDAAEQPVPKKRERKRKSNMETSSLLQPL